MKCVIVRFMKNYLDNKDFLNINYQLKNRINSFSDFNEFINNYTISNFFINELKSSFTEKNSGMAIQITPYIMSLINWQEPLEDPIRKQFLPLTSEFIPSHPMSKYDSLGEIKSEILPGIIHKYPNKILFIATQICPVYCAFCTRSYSIGPSTSNNNKIKIKTPILDRVNLLYEYLIKNENIIDVTISGGDVSLADLVVLEKIVDVLLSIKHIKSIRFGTRGLTFFPMFIIKDSDFYKFLKRISYKANKKNKIISLHTHFNHKKEFSDLTFDVISSLKKLPIKIRNQTVLLKNINSTKKDLIDLINILIEVGIDPYYIYQADLVSQTEHFRTSLVESLSLEKEISGLFPGFLTPRFVVDLLGGGGKKNISNYEFHDKKFGVFIFKSPVIDPLKVYFYFESLKYLSSEISSFWLDENKRNNFILNEIKKYEQLYSKKMDIK